MATTIGPPAGAETPPPSTSPASYAGLRSARAALRRHESPRARLVRLLVLLIAVLVLVRGWIVTDIDLGKLSNAPNAAPILKALVQPDVAARDVTPIELQGPVIVGEGSLEPVVTSSRTGQTLRITPGALSAGQTVTLDGSGF